VLLSQPDAPPPPDYFAFADFAAGCFWSPQHAFSREPGVDRAVAGFTQGVVPSPSYRAVAGGRTGHTEAVRVTFEASRVSYRRLLELFWSMLDDPTDGGGQGSDRGSSYRPGLYWHTEEQRQEAELFLLAKAKECFVAREALCIELKPATAFWPAEEAHQDYLAKGGMDPTPETPYWMGALWIRTHELCKERARP